MVETEPDRSFVCTGSCGGEKELESAKRVAGTRMTRSIQVVAGANVSHGQLHWTRRCTYKYVCSLDYSPALRAWSMALSCGICCVRIEKI